MARPILFGGNVLETPGAVVTVSGEDADHPKTRLTDGRATFHFQDTSASGTREYRWDLLAARDWTGWGIPAVPDRPHTLTGATVAILSSPDGVTTTLRDSVVPASGATFARVVAAVSARYVHLRVTGASSPPSFGELVVAPTFTLATGPSDQSLRVARGGNVVRHKTESGVLSALKRGPAQWRASYELRDLVPDVDWPLLEAWFTQIDEGARACLLLDQGGPHGATEAAQVARFAWLLNEDVVRQAAGLRWDHVALEFVEAL